MKKFIILITLIISCTISPVFAAPQESMESKSLDEHYAEAIEHVIEVALSQEGYLEKRSNANLYDFTANAGSANYTKFAQDLANHNFYGGNLNGYAWCDMFVDWCFVSAFGVADAKTITYQNPYGSAGCSGSAGFFKTVGQVYKTPQPGDQIFFGSSHTGLVYKVDGNTVYTIEGNTSSERGVVANGGAVRKKSYSLNSGRISGYGRPNYSLIAQKRKAEHDEWIRQENARLLLAQQEIEKKEKKDKLNNLLLSPELLSTSAYTKGEDEESYITNPFLMPYQRYENIVA